MNADKKQMEVLLINYFRECYADFPKGQVVASESPDFLLKMKSAHFLGIELTRLNPASAEPLTSVGQELIEKRNRFIQSVKERYEHEQGLNLFVKFLFSRKRAIGTERMLATSVKVALLIKEKVKHKNGKSFFKISIQKDLLPEGLEEVTIMYHAGMETAVWERSNNLGLSNNVIDDVVKAIQKKDEKLRLYHKQNLNYYWLLITTDRLRGVKSYNLANKINNHRFYSRFQKVFLFDLMKSKVIELV